MNFAPSFSRRTTHLLCPSKAGTKHDKAIEWSIPIINMDWLSQAASTGKVGSQPSGSDPGNNFQSQMSTTKDKEKLSEFMQPGASQYLYQILVKLTHYQLLRHSIMMTRTTNLRTMTYLMRMKTHSASHLVCSLTLRPKFVPRTS
jgi:hypothetical protein